MRRVIKLVAIGFVMLLITPIVAFGLYDVSAYQTRTNDIERLLAESTQDERKPSESLMHLFSVSLHGHTAAYTARVLIRELKVPTNNSFGWQATSALWWGLVALHMDEEEQVAILVSRSYMGNHCYGFSAESLSRFDKPLAMLNQEEEASLVALTHAPSIYQKSPERLNKRKEWLLKELRNGS
jgi:hypothetical protein